MDKTNYTLDEIKKDCNELENRILQLYLERTKQKDICEKLNITRGKIDTLVKKYKLTRFRDRANYTIDNSTLDINNINIWYYLGLFASDGNMHTVNSGTTLIQFTMDDKDVLEHIKNILKYTGEIKEYIKGNKLRYMLIISNKNLVSFTNTIFKQDCHRKTETLNYPELPNDNCRIMFLRGFIDGDGSFRASKNSNYYRFGIFCKSHNFIVGLTNDLTNILGKVPSVYNNNTIEIASHYDNYVLFKYLYEKINNNYYMQRKYIRAKQHIMAFENKQKI